ncbi:MAG TPA: hypothetical protein VF067_05535 [Sphingomicrobium sp.]
MLELYRGVLEEHSWRSALSGVSDALRGSAILLGSVGPGGAEMTGYEVDESCPALIGGPLATPAANPFLLPMMRNPLGKAVRTGQMFEDSVLIRSEVFEVGLQPFGQRYVIGALLERIGQTGRSIALTRPAGEGDYTGEEARYLDVLLPHLARAAYLREQFTAVEERSDLAFAALEAVARGIVVLDARFAIAYANREARRILALSDGITASSAGLQIEERRAAEQLRKALQTIMAQPLLGSTPLPAAIAVRRPSGRLPFRLSMVASPEFPATGNSARSRTLIITIVDPERKSLPSTILLQQLYGLTSAEARLAAELCDSDLNQAASRIGISRNTAKSHAKAIFEKVGVSRQSALVRRITLDLGE